MLNDNILITKDYSGKWLGHASTTTSTVVCPTVGDMFVSDTGNNRILVMNHVNLQNLGEFNNDGNFSAPRGVCADTDYIYVSNSGLGSVLKFDINDYTYIDGFFSESVSHPYGICGFGDWLYFVDNGVMFSNHSVWAVKKDFSDYIHACGTWGTGDDQMKFAQGIATDGEFVYIADSGNNRLVKRSCEDLSYVSQLGSVGTGDDQFHTPNGCSVYNDYLYVTESYNCRITKRNCSDLSFISKIDDTGTKAYQMQNPTSVAASPYFIYITDSIKCVVQKRKASSMVFIDGIGGSGSGIYEFSSPQGIHVNVTD
jgi:DNA-binding beta-propeller fold protein YncE